MSRLPCKIVLNQEVAAAAAAAADQIQKGDNSVFTEEVIAGLISLDLGWISAHHLIQTGDEHTIALAAKFSADVLARAAKVAAERATLAVEKYHLSLGANEEDLEDQDRAVQD